MHKAIAMLFIFAVLKDGAGAVQLASFYCCVPALLGCSSSPQPPGGSSQPVPDLLLTVLQPLQKMLPRKLTGPGVLRQLESGFLGQDGAGRLVLVRVDPALLAGPEEPFRLLGGQRWDQLGKNSEK